MSRLTRDGTAEPVSRDQILRHARGQGNVHFPCSADHEQDWQPYPVDPYSAICDDHTYIHTYSSTHIRPHHLTTALTTPIVLHPTFPRSYSSTQRISRVSSSLLYHTLISFPQPVVLYPHRAIFTKIISCASYHTALITTSYSRQKSPRNFSSHRHITCPTPLL